MVESEGREDEGETEGLRRNVGGCLIRIQF